MPILTAAARESGMLAVQPPLYGSHRIEREFREIGDDERGSKKKGAKKRERVKL